jgi:four helix bundle protein
MKDYRSLRVWERAHRLTLGIYRITTNFPHEERYGLASQMRRCSASIGANIAEGYGERGNGEFQRFLQIASGSASELDYQLLLAHDLEFLEKTEYANFVQDLGELRRMLTWLLLNVNVVAAKSGFRTAKCQVLSAALKSRHFREVEIPYFHCRYDHVERFFSAGAYGRTHLLDVGEHFDQALIKTKVA